MMENFTFERRMWTSTHEGVFASHVRPFRLQCTSWERDNVCQQRGLYLLTYSGEFPSFDDTVTTS